MFFISHKPLVLNRVVILSILEFEYFEAVFKVRPPLSEQPKIAPSL